MTAPRRLAFLTSLGVLAALLLPCAPAGADSPLALDGTVLVKAVDERRVLVAIDTSNEGRPLDGSIDHLFLFTSRTPLSLGDHGGRGPARLENDRGSLLVLWKDRKDGVQLVVENSTDPAAPSRPGVARFADALGLAHYKDYDGLRWDDLDRLQRAPSCPYSPGACYRTGEWELQFPS